MQHALLGHPQFPVEVGEKEKKSSRRRRIKRKRQHQKSPVAALLGLLPNERRK